uniref:TATA-box binding protein n=1 Tax=viral metagenome TaxID=1070528 RepID=A0A6C0J268_9ZZZZ
METNKIYFTPYRISTITCNADIGNDINLNLNILFNHLDVTEDTKIIWAQFLKDDNDMSKGLYPKKKRKSKKDSTKKNRFDNQVTIIYKFNDVYMPNIKIFKNGNIQLTGIKDTKDTVTIVNEIIDNIKKIYNIDSSIIKDDENDVKRDKDYIINSLKYQNFKIRMINSDFKIYSNEELTEKFELKRKDVHRILISDKYNNKSSFQPGIYQGVKLQYFWNKFSDKKDGICRCPVHCYGKNNGQSIGGCKKVTGALFESGSVLITGGISLEQVDETYNYICNVLNENISEIRRTKFNLKF